MAVTGKAGKTNTSDIIEFIFYSHLFWSFFIFYSKITGKNNLYFSKIRRDKYNMFIV